MTPILFFDRGCPFAHRVLALLDHLGCEVELRMSRLGDQPEGIEQYSSSGRIPLLVHGDLRLTESRVMLEYLSEYHQLQDAYPTDLRARTLHSQAMAMVDLYLVPQLFVDGGGDASNPRIGETLTALEQATACAEPSGRLLALHVAPIWWAFRNWWPNGSLTRAIAARVPLRRWLDAAVAWDCVARAALDSESLEQEFATAQRLGLFATSGC